MAGRRAKAHSSDLQECDSIGRAYAVVEWWRGQSWLQGHRARRRACRKYIQTSWGDEYYSLYDSIPQWSFRGRA